MHRITHLRTHFFGLLLFIFCITACKSKDAPTKPKENPPTVVDVMIADARPISNVIEANGTVIASETVDLHPEVTGRLTFLNVPEGKVVSEGTVLARINSADLQAQVEKSRVQLELAETNEKRLKTLLDAGGVNQANYDAVVNQVNSLKADIAYTQTLIDKTVIRAPFTGILGLRKVSPGAYVSPTMIIATIQKSGKVKIDFTLPEQFSELIKMGGKVEVEADPESDAKQSATIIALEPQANTQTRNLSVRAMLDNGTANPGAFVKVFVGSNNPKKGIMVPTNVIIPGDKENQVIVIKKGKASFISVNTGTRTESSVEITEGVKQGDTVVVTGVLFARPNGPVKIRSVKKLEQLQ